MQLALGQSISLKVVGMVTPVEITVRVEISLYLHVISHQSGQFH